MTPIRLTLKFNMFLLSEFLHFLYSYLSDMVPGASLSITDPDLPDNIGIRSAWYISS